MIRDKIKNRDIQNIDDDIIRAKRLIRDRLCNDEDIVEILHNVELEKNEAPPDEYFGTNISCSNLLTYVSLKKVLLFTKFNIISTIVIVIITNTDKIIIFFFFIRNLH